MTLAIDVPVTTTSATTSAAVVTTVVSDRPAPLSVQPTEYRAAQAAGVRVVDLRGDAGRREHGALLGALALDLDEALEALTPHAPGALRAAAHDARWLLVTEDGYDAEWLAWHLQARGVAGTRFLVGGHRALRSAGIGTADTSDAHRYFA
ncbi:rhodanese-like domain-containing protein [Gordonia caeni]|uniref:Rhodanese domain-containing protein n=1 Tax=Gordonia caeni TaxID=1007097 RepID=A0ABP7NWU8_9ACTN